MSSKWEYWLVNDHDEVWKDIHNPQSDKFLITASMVPDIIGVGTTSQGKWWDVFRGAEKNKENQYLQRMLDYGKATEELAFQDFLTKHSDWTGVMAQGTVKSSKDEGVGASPDAVVLNLNDPDIVTYPLEIKCPYPDSINEEPYPGDVLNAKPKYVVQSLMQQHCLGVENGIVHIYLATKESKTWHVPYNQGIVDGLLREIRVFRTRMKDDQRPNRVAKNKLLLSVIDKFIQNSVKSF